VTAQLRGYTLRERARSFQYYPFVFFGCIAVVLAIIVPYFLTVRNIINVLTQASTLGLLSLGMAAVLLVGGIDLSIPAVMAFSGIMGAIYMRAGGSPIVAALIMIAVSAVAGCINGLAVARLRMIPFVVTLSMQAIATGASIWVTNALSVAGIPDVYINTVLWKLWIIPLPVLVLVGLTALSETMLRRSLFGRWLYSVGTNIRASRVSGINTTRVLFGSYIFSGLMAGLVAIIMTARLSSASATMGSSNVVLDIVSSAVIGGVSIYGGSGSAIGVMLGALVITLISNSMNFLHVPYYLTLIIKGAVIIVAIASDSIRKR
jgi:ribose/xylose/arabinose/galactoside ABC-type transport system permease subunit